jgi:predicted nucleotidyltransferase component of viral defense system
MKANQFTGRLADIQAWCKDYGIAERDARKRYVEHAILGCIAKSGKLRSAIVFKGGNALRIMYGSSRSTLDLDFTALPDTLSDDEDALREIMNAAFYNSAISFGVKLRCQKVKRNPKSPEATRPTFELSVAYQFPGDRYFDCMETQKINETVPVEISLNDVVCGISKFSPVINDRSTIQVCSLEDILAEKLRSILQQKIRNRNRSQDVYDIALFAKSHADSINWQAVYMYFAIKCQARGVIADKREFDMVIREMAYKNYDEEIQRQTRGAFIPFDEAWHAVKTVVEGLPNTNL